jgi:DNA-binding response OmpR family regulator
MAFSLFPAHFHAFFIGYRLVLALEKRYPLKMQQGISGSNRLSVLVVDDDRAISKLLRQNLEDAGTRVTEAASGLEAINALQDHKVDMVLLDIRLPDFSGWGILSLLRLTEALRELPVIVVSEEPPNATLVDRLRPDDYIRKPFDMRDLVSRVGRVADARNLQKGLADRAG